MDNVESIKKIALLLILLFSVNVSASNHLQNIGNPQVSDAEFETSMIEFFFGILDFFFENVFIGSFMVVFILFVVFMGVFGYLNHNSE